VGKWEVRKWRAGWGGGAVTVVVVNEELATGRLSLRRPTLADLGSIYTITANPAATWHNPSDAIRTRGQAAELFERWDEQWLRYGFGYWVIRLHGSARVLGFCGLKVMQFHGETVLNLFYRLDPTAWGNGFASEAATAAVDWAAENVPLSRVIARVRPDNLGSQRVALAAGLVRAPELDGPGYDGLDWIYSTY
jgi:ribosomal-protein-alanine N-acetyltransferase